MMCVLHWLRAVVESLIGLWLIKTRHALNFLPSLEICSMTDLEIADSLSTPSGQNWWASSTNKTNGDIFPFLLASKSFLEILVAINCLSLKWTNSERSKTEICPGFANSSTEGESTLLNNPLEFSSISHEIIGSLVAGLISLASTSWISSSRLYTCFLVRMV